MAMMMGNVYDALRSATGVTEDQARKASEELARVADAESNITILKWMVGTLTALTLGTLGLQIKLIYDVAALAAKIH